MSDTEGGPDFSETHAAYGAECSLTPAEVRVVAGAVANAVAASGDLTAVQRAVLNAMCELLLGVAVDLGSVDRADEHDLAEVLQDDPALSVRVVHSMLVGQLILVPAQPDIADSVQRYSTALRVDDEVLRLARLAADRGLELAMVDFQRSGYFDHLRSQPAIRRLSSLLDDDGGVWQRVWDDPGMYNNWCDLSSCPEGSLGRGVWRFYMARGFVFPGREGSAPPVLAQHDWIHVLADYGSTVESEIEVFGLIARANQDFDGFALLAMVLSLFETGAVAEAAGGFFQQDSGHISGDPQRMGIRLADAMARGKKIEQHLAAVGRPDESDLMAVDWFEHADRPIEEVRAWFGLSAKSDRAKTAGSVGPWEPGGLSEYQFRLGQSRACEAGREYRSFGATPLG